MAAAACQRCRGSADARAHRRRACCGRFALSAANRRRRRGTSFGGRIGIAASRTDETLSTARRASGRDAELAGHGHRPPAPPNRRRKSFSTRATFTREEMGGLGDPEDHQRIGAESPCPHERRGSDLAAHQPWKRSSTRPRSARPSMERTDPAHRWRPTSGRRDAQSPDRAARDRHGRNLLAARASADKAAGSMETCSLRWRKDARPESGRCRNRSAGSATRR